MGSDIKIEFGTSTQLMVAMAEMLAADMAKHLGDAPEDVYEFPSSLSEA